MRRRLPILILAAILAGCGSGVHVHVHGSAATSVTESPVSAAKPPAASSAACHAAPPPRPEGAQHLAAPTSVLNPARKYTVTVVTNCGAFAFRLDVRAQPKTAASVYWLVRRGFYDGLTLHRVAAGFVIQGGDPLGTGAGGPGYTVVEPPPRDTEYVRGDVAMAKTETQPAGASGSQFFIVTGANVTQSAGLAPDYALAGRIVSGARVVQAIGSLPTSPPSDGMPTPTVVMSRVTVAVSAPR